MQVPWTSLGKSPVLVELDRLYILAGPKEDNLAEDVPEVSSQLHYDLASHHDNHPADYKYLRSNLLLIQAEGDDLDAIERAVKRRRVHDAELAWTSVSGSLRDMH